MEVLTMSNNTVVVPVGVIACIREGIDAVARDVAEAIDQAASRAELFGARDRLGGVCALLDCLGQVSWEDGTGVEVDVREHGAALAAAIDELCLVALGDLSGDDHATPEREEEYRLLLELQAGVRSVLGWSGTVRIPAGVVVALREGLVSLLDDVAGELDEVLVRPVRARGREWVKPVMRFDRVRAVLDLVGWEQRDPELGVEVDARWYGQTVKDALERELDSTLHLAETGDERQRERASAAAGVIERFLDGLVG
jgi:hypothetical protein